MVFIGVSADLSLISVITEVISSPIVVVHVNMGQCVSAKSEQTLTVSHALLIVS